MENTVSFADEPETDKTATLRSTSQGLEENIDDKFLFTIDALLAFMFPENLQHPLAASRLIIFGMYGPLDDRSRLHSGRKGEHILMEYELDQMCQQIEREDLVSVYLHRQRDLGLLTVAEQDALLNQADAHLKKEKGKAMLPRITKEDVVNLLKPCRRCRGKLSFHDAQKIISDWRQFRVAQYKLVFPKLGAGSSNSSSSSSASKTEAPSSSQSLLLQSSSSTSLKKTTASSSSSSSRVGPHIAPTTMFLRMQGNTTADLIQQNTTLLSHHAFKIRAFEHGASDHALTANVRLLREAEPRFPDPPKNSKKADWDGSSLLRGAALGSMVKSTSSNTTWKRKYTSY